MASNVHVAAAYNKGMLDATKSLIADANAGKIKIYAGTQPADADASNAGTLLSTLTMNATAFAAPAGTASTNQTATANSITSDTNAAATGTAAFFVLTKSDGTTVILMGSVGTSASDLNLNTTSITAGATVACSSFTITLNK